MIIHAPDPWFINEAAKRGVFAYITDGEARDWQSSIDIVLRLFSEYHNLEGAFGRRALIERAKSILMERHTVDERQAFELLRQQARNTQVKGRRCGDCRRSRKSVISRMRRTTRVVPY